MPPKETYLCILSFTKGELKEDSRIAIKASPILHAAVNNECDCLALADNENAIHAFKIVAEKLTEFL